MALTSPLASALSEKMGFPLPFSSSTDLVAAALARLKALGPVEMHLPGDFTPNGSNAAAWKGASGTGIGPDAAQATGAAQPLINADGSINTDGLAQYLASTGLTLVQPCTYYIRAKVISLKSNNDGFLTGATQCALYLQGVNFGLFAGTITDTGVAVPVGTMVTICCVFNGAASSFRDDAGHLVTGLSPGAGAAGAGLVISNFGGALTRFANQKVGAVMATPQADSPAAQIQALADLKTVCDARGIT